MTLAEKDFHNQVNRMTCSVDSIQPFPSATFIIDQWAREKDGHCGSNGSYVKAQKHGLPCPEEDLATATAECLVFQQQRATQSV